MNGPTVIGMRGPILCASAPARAENASMTSVMGRVDTPAASADHPAPSCSCRIVSVSAALNAA